MVDITNVSVPPSSYQGLGGYPWDNATSITYRVGRSIRRRLRGESESGGSEYATFALVLDFEDPAYWTNGNQTAILTDVAGYSFTRSGSIGIVDSAGEVSYFAENIPAVNDLGYHAYKAMTNYLPYSQDFSNGWGLSGRPWINYTANAGLAPDGTMTADRIETSGNGGPGSFVMRTPNGLSNAAAHTHSIWVRSFSALPYNLRLRGNWATSGDTLIAVTDAWQRVSLVRISESAFEEFYFGAVAAGDSPNFDILIWQGQTLNGNFPDGGPVILTGASAASIGASALTIGVENGTYDAVYTFDDDSTQTIPVTIADGTFEHPTNNVLNRPAVKLVTL